MKKKKVEGIEFGKQLKALRITHNLSQATLAEIINMSEERIGDLEGAKNLPSYKTLRKLRKEFNIDINAILDATNMELDSKEDNDE